MYGLGEIVAMNAPKLKPIRTENERELLEATRVLIEQWNFREIKIETIDRLRALLAKADQEEGK